MVIVVLTVESAQRRRHIENTGPMPSPGAPLPQPLSLFSWISAPGSFCVNTGGPHPTLLVLNTKDGMPLVLGTPLFS